LDTGKDLAELLVAVLGSLSSEKLNLDIGVCICFGDIFLLNFSSYFVSPKDLFFVNGTFYFSIFMYL